MHQAEFWGHAVTTNQLLQPRTEEYSLLGLHYIFSHRMENIDITVMQIKQAEQLTDQSSNSATYSSTNLRMWAKCLNKYSNALQ